MMSEAQRHSTTERSQDCVSMANWASPRTARNRSSKSVGPILDINEFLRKWMKSNNDSGWNFSTRSSNGPDGSLRLPFCGRKSEDDGMPREPLPIDDVLPQVVAAL